MISALVVSSHVASLALTRTLSSPSTSYLNGRQHGVNSIALELTDHALAHLATVLTNLVAERGRV